MANDDEEEDEDQDRDENGDAAGIDESAVMDAIEEADSTADENQHQVDFDATDHTDLYTAKRDRDRARGNRRGKERKVSWTKIKAIE